MAENFDDLLTSIAKWIHKCSGNDSPGDEELIQAFSGTLLTKLMAQM